jgi:hypothetical protein
MDMTASKWGTFGRRDLGGAPGSGNDDP